MEDLVLYIQQIHRKSGALVHVQTVNLEIISYFQNQLKMFSKFFDQLIEYECNSLILVKCKNLYTNSLRMFQMLLLNKSSHINCKI